MISDNHRTQARPNFIDAGGGYINTKRSQMINIFFSLELNIANILLISLELIILSGSLHWGFLRILGLIELLLLLLLSILAFWLLMILLGVPLKDRNLGEILFLIELNCSLLSFLHLSLLSKSFLWESFLQIIATLKMDGIF